MEKVHNVRFICIGNSARSILAEGPLDDMDNSRSRRTGACPIRPLSKERTPPGSAPFASPPSTMRRRLERRLALPRQSLATLAIERDIESIGKL